MMVFKFGNSFEKGSGLDGTRVPHHKLHAWWHVARFSTSPQEGEIGIFFFSHYDSKGFTVLSPICILYCLDSFAAVIKCISLFASESVLIEVRRNTVEHVLLTDCRLPVLDQLLCEAGKSSVDGRFVSVVDSKFGD
jgi:hypothetical protein